MYPLSGMISTCVRPRPMNLSGFARASRGPRAGDRPPAGSEQVPESSVSFPGAETADDRGVVLVGGDLEPATLLAAYRRGLFPMRDGSGALAWWSPDPRGILDPSRLRVSSSLKQACRRFEIRVDTAFEAVIDGCADRGHDEYRWITPEVRMAYVTLHRMGWAHSVEAWTRPTNGRAELVGGLYGVAIGGLFGGESMFHSRPDASKVALVALVDLLRQDTHDGRLIDVQWLTPHLASLGATEITRGEYCARLTGALAGPLPSAFARTP
ncbi:MAG: leucyl/phenylalanyl-tRNA--protein transferase [Actinomycetota bacterium]|nr:leucyl/phenylalanyl-tRNA--protein transferase [Actinomycetota bacterium]